MRLKLAKKIENESPAIAEILLSKSTFKYSTPLSFKQRVGWLRYELPSSLAPKHYLLYSVLFGLPFSFTLSTNPDISFLDLLIHPSFLVAAIVSPLFVWSVFAAIVLITAGSVYLLNPREFMNLYVYPDVLRIKDDMLELRWNQHLFFKQLRIPWNWLSSVRVRDYLHTGVIPMKILELELSEIPALYHEWKLLQKISRDGAYFLDPSTNSLPRPFALGGVRLPIPLFAFAADAESLIQFIQKKCAPGVVESGTLNALGAENENEANLETFTTMWLAELNSNTATDLQRLLPSGTQLQDGAFTLNGVLGTGGLSIVYEGRQGDSPIAIKEILCNFGGTKRSVEQNLRHVLNEVCILRRLDHPNVVNYRACFVEGNKLYIVMDLVRGVNLRDYIESHPQLEEAELLDLAKQCCSVLEYLHSQSRPIIHRDFTPDNLMLADGTVKLIDFNIAQSAITSSSSTVMGKHSFMAPEQFCGESSISSDLYQLGRTLCFLATARDPEPLSPCNLTERSDLSNQFKDLVLKLTEREPARRFSSARDVMESLSRFTNETNVHMEVA